MPGLKVQKNCEFFLGKGEYLTVGCAVLMHRESLNRESAALAHCPESPVLFILDGPEMAARGSSRLQIGFFCRGARAVLEAAGREYEIRLGSPGEEIDQFVRKHGVDVFHVDRSASGWFDDLCGAVGGGVEIVVHSEEPAVGIPGNLKRFKPFWELVRRELAGGSFP